MIPTRYVKFRTYCKILRGPYGLNSCTVSFADNDFNWSGYYLNTRLYLYIPIVTEIVRSKPTATRKCGLRRVYATRITHAELAWDRAVYAPYTLRNERCNSTPHPMSAAASDTANKYKAKGLRITSRQCRRDWNTWSGVSCNEQLGQCKRLHYDEYKAQYILCCCWGIMKLVLCIEMYYWYWNSD